MRDPGRTHLLSRCLVSGLAGLREKFEFFAVPLSGANLDRTNLSKANLWNADLSMTSLFYANLSCADLSGAKLSEANLSGANFAEIKWSRNTSWPASEALERANNMPDELKKELGLS